VVLAGPKAKGPKDKIAPGLAKVLEYCQGSREIELPVIVQVNPDSFHAQGAPPGLLKAKALALINGFAGKMSAKNIRALENSPWIEYVTVNPLVRATGKPPKDDGGWDTVSMKGNPYAETVGLEQTYRSAKVINKIGHSGRGVTVAVFDSGFMNHSDLSGGSKNLESVDFTTGVPLVEQRRNDGYGHGTHVTGVIGGSGHASKGEIASIAPGAE
jgi:subtilisin family serine protease